MGVWGKIIGGFAGFAIGGPLGGILGAAFGHAIDKAKIKRNVAAEDIESLQAAYTIGVIVLSAKMAKADGQVTRDEIETFKKVFGIPESEFGQVGKIFDQARKDAEGYEPYAKQLGSLFSGEPAILQNLLGCLFEIAMADGILHEQELAFIEKVAKEFGFAPSIIDGIKSGYSGGQLSNPYKVLGVSKESSDQEIKDVYRKLIKENHPDMLIAKGMPEEFVETANNKMAQINSAYEEIEKIRGLK